MELSSNLDPEDYFEFVRAYHERAGELVVRYGGHVAQFLGDGVLAYFGYPRAHEDATERAVRAGLALIDALDEFERDGTCGCHSASASTPAPSCSARPAENSIKRFSPWARR